MANKSLAPFFGQSTQEVSCCIPPVGFEGNLSLLESCPFVFKVRDSLQQGPPSPRKQMAEYLSWEPPQKWLADMNSS